MEEQENVATEMDNDLPQNTLEDMMDTEFGVPGAPGAGTTEEAAEGSETAADASQAEAAAVADQVKADAAQEATETAEAAEAKAKEVAEPDAFDSETAAKVAEMQNDSHPGIKFAELRRELKEAREENERIATEGTNTEEFQQLKLKAEQAEGLRQQVTDLRSDLALNDYKSTTEFDSLVNKPLSEIQVLSKNIEEVNGLAEGSIMGAIQTTDQALQTEAIERLVESGGLNGRDQNRIYTAADRYLQVRATDSALKESATTRMQELDDMQVSQQTAANAQNAAALRSGVEGAFSRYEGRIPGFVTDDGLPTESYTNYKAEASNVQLNTIEDASFAIMAATLLPDVLNTNKDLMAQLAEKNKALAKFGKSGVPSGTAVEATPAKTAAPVDFMDALDAFDATGT